MQNDPGRHWTMLVPHVPGEVLATQAQMTESAGLMGIGATIAF